MACVFAKDGRFQYRKGQALVEFALILPFLIILVLGIMEFGWLTKNQLTVILLPIHQTNFLVS